MVSLAKIRNLAFVMMLVTVLLPTPAYSDEYPACPSGYCNDCPAPAGMYWDAFQGSCCGCYFSSYCSYNGGAYYLCYCDRPC
jgi:hypothetical protein